MAFTDLCCAPSTSFVSDMSDPTQRFSDRVENYVRHRPSYPPALLQILQAKAGLTRASVIADIGSGTGIFTALLLPFASQVFAIEPNAAMRSAAEQALGASPGFRSIAGTAEVTTLPHAAVDLITVAQAFHWFNIPACHDEFARILRPGGRVALIWNERLTDTTPFLVAYEQLLRTGATDYDQVNHTRIDPAAIAGFFAPATCEAITLPNTQSFDLPGLIGRALSSSYVPNVGRPGHQAFMGELTRIFQQHAVGDRVTFHYLTRLYLGSLT